ncbi:MAG TPA: alpha-amylase family glycosyl hydrolase, partial [Bacilli bacterium]|nr:alpha-amylase family glycosyl hydrolase [Bacilli bacterium]
YAKSSGVNGLRGQIIDFSRYESSSFDQSINNLTPIAGPTDLVVYEMQVSDLTWDQTWTGTEANRGKYLGLIEEGTTYTSGSATVTTGFDHIKELGVNAVQIMPFYDQSNYEIDRKELLVDEAGNPILDDNNKQQFSNIIPSHNWGYNPLNFNALEGVYASSPYRGEVKVQEFKQVVETYANNDIRIIMDVVYNHVASASASNFNKLVPGYYFRYNQDWSLNNDSGVGNVFASENPMASKFIIESVLFWAREYNIKGFRFDLMELISDETLIALDKALNDEGFYDVVIWGEPWHIAGYSGGYKTNRGSLKNTRVAAFNDQGRNALKGENGIRQNSQWAWINKGTADNFEQPYLNKVKGLLAGIHGSYYDDNGNFDSKLNNNPNKAVNYAGSHDNFSLFDQMLFSSFDSEETAMRAATTANAVILTSQGIPFFQGGDEIGRSKPFDETSPAGAAFIATHFNESAELNGQFYSGNSYNIGYETNSYKWDDKIRWFDYFEAYKNLINLRLSAEGAFLRLGSANAIASNFQYWQNTVPELSWSVIASENKFAATNGYLSPGTVYSFYAARIDDDGTKTQTFAWSTAGVQVRVIFDSEGELTGQILTNQVKLGRFRVILVERL